MEITPYVDTLRAQLMVAGQAGGEDARALAERLTAALDPAVRLALLDALSDAAGEITEELAPGSVDVRLRGGHPEFVVTSPVGDTAEEWGADSATPPAPPTPAPAPEGSEAEDGGTARITLRLPEQFKPRIEEAARSENLSVNAWLVRAVSAALDPSGPDRPSTGHPGPHLGQNFTGWVR